MDQDSNQELRAKFEQSIGRMTVAWNNTHGRVFLLFKLLTKMPMHIANAAFWALKADTAQRDMTLAVARAALKDAPELCARITSTLNKIGALAAERNAAVHTAWQLDEDVGYRPMSDFPMRPVLKDVESKELFDSSTQKIREIGKELTLIIEEVINNSRLPFKLPPQSTGSKES